MSTIYRKNNIVYELPYRTLATHELDSFSCLTGSFLTDLPNICCAYSRRLTDTKIEHIMKGLGIKNPEEQVLCYQGNLYTLTFSFTRSQLAINRPYVVRQEEYLKFKDDFDFINDTIESLIMVQRYLMLKLRHLVKESSNSSTQFITIAQLLPEFIHNRFFFVNSLPDEAVKYIPYPDENLEEQFIEFLQKDNLYGFLI